MKPDISFVVPVYNKQSYIAETLENLKAQTHKNIEIIVVDDCSTDNSLEIIRYFLKDKRFKCMSLTENKGRSYARNYGNNLARAGIIAVNDADDLSHLNRAEDIIKAFKDNGDMDVFYSGFMSADENANVNRAIPGIKVGRKKVIKDGCTYIGHSTMAYRSHVARDMKYSEGMWSDLGLDDWKLQMDMFKAGYVMGFNAEPLVVYRDIKNGIVHTRDGKEVERIKKQYLRGFK